MIETGVTRAEFLQAVGNERHRTRRKLDDRRTRDSDFIPVSEIRFEGGASAMLQKGVDYVLTVHDDGRAVLKMVRS